MYIIPEIISPRVCEFRRRVYASIKGCHAARRKGCRVEILCSCLRALLARGCHGERGKQVVLSWQETTFAYRYANLIASAIPVNLCPYVPVRPATYEGKFRDRIKYSARIWAHPTSLPPLWPVSLPALPFGGRRADPFRQGRHCHPGRSAIRPGLLGILSGCVRPRWPTDRCDDQLTRSRSRLR